MSNAEINQYISASTAGRKKKGRTWSHYVEKVPTFDPSLVFRPKGPVDAKADVGALIMPKLFRRQTTWWAYKQSGFTSKNFKDYLTEKHDPLMLTSDFLANGVHSSTPHFFDEFLVKGALTLRPEDMVFMEKPSTLVDANGKKITAW